MAEPADNPVISDLADDSRRVKPGSLFVARDTGDDRWRGYVETAVEQGAAAVIAPAPITVRNGVAVGVASRVDQAFAGRLAASFFGHPAKRLQLVGVTGTNGKTTVATLTQHLLNAHGIKCGFIGTTAIDTGCPDGPQPAELTTPGAIDLQRLFAQMVEYGCEACAMEVSSHALDQGRVDGLNFAAAVFTNLSQDHLDYHGDMTSYAAAKAKLFAGLCSNATAVINADADDHSHAMAGATNGHVRWTSSRLSSSKYDDGPDQVAVCVAKELAASHSVAEFHGPWGATSAKLPLIGQHNLNNLLQAIVAVDALQPWTAEGLGEACSGLPVVPGRLEPVRIGEQSVPAVLVDYAHTPDALHNVLNALRPVAAEGGKLIVVFGCGGDRDRTKRPLMAQAACGLADFAVLTSDNPRTEDPQQILDDAIAGVTGESKHKLVIEIDRAKAIRLAISEANSRDTVLIAGKGHEDYQILGTEKIHFDDREHADAALQEWLEQTAGGSRE